jgi:hypothetical protein
MYMYMTIHFPVMRPYLGCAAQLEEPLFSNLGHTKNQFSCM